MLRPLGAGPAGHRNSANGSSTGSDQFVHCNSERLDLAYSVEILDIEASDFTFTFLSGWSLLRLMPDF